jgi:hypothetical protein
LPEAKHDIVRVATLRAPKPRRQWDRPIPLPPGCISHPERLLDRGKRLTGVIQKPLDYWFWCISEGGTAEPFHSRGSVMPGWKYRLSELERWQVIAFARTLSAGVAGE